MTTENEPKEQPQIQAASQPAEEPKTEKKEEPKVRVFVYDGREFSDPDPKMTTDEVRQYYTTFFPELANAEVQPAVERAKKDAPGLKEQVIEFKRRTGTKGR